MSKAKASLEIKQRDNNKTMLHNNETEEPVARAPVPAPAPHNATAGVIAASSQAPPAAATATGDEDGDPSDRPNRHGQVSL